MGISIFPESNSVLPVSIVSRSESDEMRSRTSSPIFQRILPRSAPDMRAQGPDSSAVRAAATAASMSSAPASATEVMTDSSAGLTVVNVRPDRASVQSPPIRRRPRSGVAVVLMVSSDTYGRIEQPLILLGRVAVRHPRDVVGDRAVDSLRIDLAPRVVGQEPRVLEVAIEEGVQDARRLVLHALDAMMLVEVPPQVELQRAVLGRDRVGQPRERLPRGADLVDGTGTGALDPRRRALDEVGDQGVDQASQGDGAQGAGIRARVSHAGTFQRLSEQR